MSKGRFKPQYNYPQLGSAPPPLPKEPEPAKVIKIGSVSVDIFSDGHIVVGTGSGQPSNKFLEKTPWYIVSSGVPSDANYAVIVLSGTNRRELLERCAGIVVAEQLEK